MTPKKLILYPPDMSLAQLYLDIAGVIIIVITNNGIITEINRKGCEVLGYPKNQIIGKNWFDNFLPERIRSEIKANFRRMLTGTITLEHYENPVLARDGKERTIAWHNSYLRDREGKIIGTLSSGEDITERKRLEAELDNYRRRLEQGLAERTADFAMATEKLTLTEAERHKAETSLQLRAAMLDMAPEAIFLIDMTGNLLYVNRAAYKTFEFDIDKQIGQSFWDLVQPQSKSIIESALEQLKEKRDLVYETYYVRKNGDMMPVQVHSSLISTPNGDLVLSIVHDVTKLKDTYPNPIS